MSSANDSRTGGIALPPEHPSLSTAPAEAVDPRADRLAPVRTPSLTESVYEAIRKAIVDRTLPPGSPVSEAELAARLQVSKTPVREALLHLRSVGLVEGEGRRTPSVVTPGREKLAHSYEMREALEVFAAATAATRATPEELELVLSAASRSLAMAEAGDTPGYREADLSFHRQVVLAAHNPRLATTVENTFDLIAALRERDLPGDHFSLKCAQAHTQIARAIADRDAAVAAEEMRRHIHVVRDEVLAQVPDSAS